MKEGSFMEKVVITLRIDNEVGELLLEVDGQVENEQHTIVLLGFMSSILKMATQYGGKWVPLTRLVEKKRNQVVDTFSFPDAKAKEQFFLQLQELDHEAVP